MNAIQILNQTYSHVDIPDITFSEKWNGGINYFDNAVSGKHAPKLNPGVRAKSITPNGSKIIFVGTNIGNAIVFEKHIDFKNSFIVVNMPRVISSILNIGVYVSAQTTANILGIMFGRDMIYSFQEQNIGHKVLNILNFLGSYEEE